MVVTGFSFLMLRLAVARALRLSGKLHTEDALVRYKHYASLALYLMAIPLAHFHPYLALAAIALVTAVWIIPNLDIYRPSTT